MLFLTPAICYNCRKYANPENRRSFWRRFAELLWNIEKDKMRTTIMRKHVRLTLCCAAAVLLAAGCGKKSDTAETTTAASETQAEITDKGEVTNLGQYKGVEVTKEDTTVSDAELDQRIANILQANPEVTEITDRPAQEGDTVNIDYVGMKDGVAFDGGTAEGYELELGSGVFIPGFEDGLIGVSTGEERSLNLTFPENYGNADLAGQAVVFDVTVNKIEEKKNAILDDAFVQRVSDFSTVDEFHADTLATLQNEKEQDAEQQIKNDAFQAAVDNSEYSLNEAAVEQEYNSQVDSYETSFANYGMTIASYAEMLGQTEDEFKETLRKAAETGIKQQLLIQAIAEKEGLTIEDADRENLAEQFGTDVETLKNAYGDELVDELAMTYKVVDFIADNAVVK